MPLLLFLLVAGRFPGQPGGKVSRTQSAVVRPGEIEGGQGIVAEETVLHCEHRGRCLGMLEE